MNCNKQTFLCCLFLNKISLKHSKCMSFHTDNFMKKQVNMTIIITGVYNKKLISHSSYKIIWCL